MNTNPEACIYCSAPATTRDHVPPACLFPHPRPSNLTTVPACQPCNERWSKDIEYFRAVLLASANLEQDVAASRVRDVVVRSLRRQPDPTRPSASHSAGFASLIRSSIVDAEHFSAGGIYLGLRPAMKMDLARVHTVLRQTIRGLSFLENGRVLPRDYDIRVVLDQFGENVHRSMLGTFGGRVRAPIRRFAEVFEYAVIPAGNEPTSLWVGCFFRRVYFMAHVHRAAEDAA